MMKKVRFETKGKPLVIEQTNKPTLGSGELLLKVTACGICGSDLHGTQPQGIYPPGTIMGHEFAGIIEEASGDQKDNWSIGERVTAFPGFFCGQCKSCRNGQAQFCEKFEPIGIGARDGAFAEYVVIDAKSAVQLPTNVSDQFGALVEPLATGLHAFNWGKAAAQKQGMLIIGAGPIGLAIALWGREQGIKNVIISELSPERLEMAKQVSTQVIDANLHSDPVVAYRELTGEAPSAIFEAVGIPGLIQSMLPSIAPRTQVVVVGAGMEMDQIHPLTACFKEVNLTYSLAYDLAEFKEVVNKLACDAIDPSFMVTDTISLDELPKAFEALRTPTGQCKIIVRP